MIRSFIGKGVWCQKITRALYKYGIVFEQPPMSARGGLEKLIPVINKIQDVFNAVGVRDRIELPQIAVIGTQSAGKSSVLENVVGKDFLPRGTGIVTRRPLVLQLVHVKPDEAGPLWGWGQFLHCEGRVFEDFAEIRDEISRETDKLAGTNKGISNTPITLTIRSPHVLDLTLIDLPGITRVPVGDQPEDIEAQTYNMSLEFIRNPKCIILAVHAANTDLSTSESLKLARQVDPDGNRTLVVCTKLDLMDAGTDAQELLKGEVIPVKLGIIGVVNRSQKDIAEGKAIEEALQKEQQFFEHKYPALVSRNGSPYLARTLNRLLMRHIRSCLPQLKHDIATRLSQFVWKRNGLGEPLKNKASTLLQVLTKFASTYCQKIEGNSKSIDTQQISGGARICFVFHRTFAMALSRIEPLEGLSPSDINHAISNAMGPKPGLFISEVAFELLVKKQIRLLRNPSLQCVELVYEEMQLIIQDCLAHIPEFQRFPALREGVNQVSTKLLRERLPVTNEMVQNLVAIELAYVNTNHPDFVGGHRAAYEAYMKAQTRELAGAATPATSDVTASSSPPSQSAKMEAVQAGSVYSQVRAGAKRMVESAGLFGRQDGLNEVFAEGGASLSTATPTPIAAPRAAQQGAQALTSKQSVDIDLIQKLIGSYFMIVKKNIQDAVPKAVMHCMVNYIQETLQRELVQELYKLETFDDLLEESKEIAARRHEIQEMIEALEKASLIIGEIRSFQLESDDDLV